MDRKSESNCSVLSESPLILGLIMEMRKNRLKATHCKHNKHVCSGYGNGDVDVSGNGCYGNESIHQTGESHKKNRQNIMFTKYYAKSKEI